MSDWLPGVTRIAQAPPFIRDAANLQRIFNLWLLALLPCVLAGISNTGYQANLVMQALDLQTIPGWRGQVLQFSGFSYQAESLWSNVIHGAMYFLPLFFTALLTTLFWERVFARLRRSRTVEGATLLSLLFVLTLPPNLPLWQVAAGMSFAVVIGKEIFGGTGYTLVHPVLAGRAFLYFAYPDQLSGDSIWTSVDAMAGATPLAIIKSSGLEALQQSDVTQSVAFIGQIPGSLGETSTLAIMLGAALLLWTRLISWRIVSGALIGVFAAAWLFNQYGSDANFMASVSWSWHVVLGGFAFALVFIATDPVTSPHTQAGRWIYGGLIGLLLVLIRVGNPAIPEGAMFAVLLANVLAPLIDYLVAKYHIQRKRAGLTFPSAENKGHD